MVFVWIAVGVLFTAIVWAVNDRFEKLKAERDFWKEKAEKINDELFEYKSPLYHVRKMKERGEL